MPEPQINMAPCTVGVQSKTKQVMSSEGLFVWRIMLSVISMDTAFPERPIHSLTADSVLSPHTGEDRDGG